MSDDSNDKREWGFYVDEMIGFAERILCLHRQPRSGRFCRQRADLLMQPCVIWP
uniref:Uncharacterized protein n=1 Tax=Candidatus Kentrum sp. SD TaxID=2126332 RepID=A0A450Y4X0_9GAMM|nr:MAG: hypothetical protein BECKSD772F_GA0070984_100317 [Candidatus Kentron sp. SD]